MSVQRFSGWGLRGEPSPASLAKTPSFCSVEMFTKSSSSLVSAGWVPLSISLSEDHKMFMRKPCLEIEFRGVLLSERGGRDAFEWRKTMVGIFPVSNACQYKSCQSRVQLLPPPSPLLFHTIFLILLLAKCGSQCEEIYCC